MFEVVFFVVCAVLAVWIDVRFPNFAPSSFNGRLAAGVVATFLLPMIPVDVSSQRTLMMSMFLGVLPALTFAFLTGLWLLRSLREVAQTHRM